MAQKIAMLGGTYDPIHNGHIALGRHFADLLGLDRVLIVPTRVPPHKEATATPQDMRLEMCRLAALEDERMEASDIELRRDGLSYSYLTVCSLREMYKDAELYLIIGADMFMSLETWYKYDLLKELVTFCAVPRDDVSASELRDHAARLEAEGARTIISDGMKMDISSTEIRDALAKGESIEGKVPERVEWYILANGLYVPRTETRRLTETERSRYTALIERRLEKERFEHSVNVSKQALHLARKYGADEYKAELAGLLHDVAKNDPRERQLEYICLGGVQPDADLMASEKVWHSHAGAQFLLHELSITDEDILNSVRYHTSGRANMSLLEKIIYLADYTSEERDYNGVEEMKCAVEVSLRKAMLIALRFTISKLAEKGSPIHPDTVAAYNEIVTDTAEE
ncbi:MAG: nicotinate-nucleotide adenylyltransferase [Clostridia bacterium]|nr:nicotinate-nucleotide adenylyltransferase [Clostridia bacterium]